MYIETILYLPNGKTYSTTTTLLPLLFQEMLCYPCFYWLTQDLYTLYLLFGFIVLEWFLYYQYQPLDITFKEVKWDGKFSFSIHCERIQKSNDNRCYKSKFLSSYYGIWHMQILTYTPNISCNVMMYASPFNVSLLERVWKLFQKETRS